MKPRLRLFASIPHPSTRMNNISLKGREIITGGSIIIPALSKTLAITISISKKGIKPNILIKDPDKQLQKAKEYLNGK